MKSNKEVVLDFIQKYCASQSEAQITGISTQFLSEKLAMQRTNLSSILNQLVKEGKVEKMNGRPVLYRIVSNKTSGSEYSCFKNLIGNNGSMKSAVQLAKAAILYPTHSLHSLIIGPSGSGKSYFARLMHNFAIENRILKEDAPFVRFNCRHFSDNSLQMVDELFGTASKECAVLRAQNGVLVIDHCDALAPIAKNMLVDLLEGNYENLPDNLKEKGDLNIILICCVNSEVNSSNIDFLSNRIPVRIILPSLMKRPLQERLELIQHFFMREATRMKHTININSELLRCLLLYECIDNVKQLHTDIKLGCANAYAREFNNEEKKMNLFVSDFSNYVRKGFLEYKKYRNEIERLIPENCEYSFSEFSSDTKEILDHIMDYSMEPVDVYERISKKGEELQKRGISKEDINLIVSFETENMIREYMNSLDVTKINTEQLSKIVDVRLIDLVNRFLEGASKLFNRIYPISVSYGLCLHLSSTLNRNTKTQRLNNQQIMEVVESYKNEYSYSMKFASEFERIFNVSLPIDEVVFITMFISDKALLEATTKKPVILFAMHGNQTASSLADVVNSLVKTNNCYAFDMSLDSEPKQAYEELKNLVMKINQGKGILMMYDMGSLKTMAEMVSQELGIVIRSVEIPITLLGLDCARKAAMGIDINELYDNVMGNYRLSKENYAEQTPSSESKKIIISLCMSGEGGALQIKTYLENNVECIKKGLVEVVSLAINDRDHLLKSVNALSKKHEILCAVGSFNPYLFNIPYVSIAELFNADKSTLDTLLFTQDVSELTDIDYDSIYDYLKSQLSSIDVDTLRPLLQECITNIRHGAREAWSEEQECGLLVHIACCINRLKNHEEGVQNVYADVVVSNNESLYEMLVRVLKPLEEAFDVAFDKNEISIIISIIKKI